MSGVALDLIGERAGDAIKHAEGRPLITTLGLIEGEILIVLERSGSCTLRELVRSLEWPFPLVMMAVGGLVRERLIRATEYALEIVLERALATSPAAVDVDEAQPQIWGGSQRR